MPKLSDRLREAAELVESREDFICLALGRVSCCQDEAAEQYLEWLGMPLHGGGFAHLKLDGKSAEYEERWALRVWWCYFAADLWDEGVRP
jgi:hypothetical protein